MDARTHRIAVPALTGVVTQVEQTWFACRPVTLVRVQVRARPRGAGGAELHDLVLREPCERDAPPPYVLGDRVVLAPEDAE